MTGVLSFSLAGIRNVPTTAAEYLKNVEQLLLPGSLHVYTQFLAILSKFKTAVDANVGMRSAARQVCICVCIYMCNTKISKTSTDTHMRANSRTQAQIRTKLQLKTQTHARILSLCLSLSLSLSLTHTHTHTHTYRLQW